MTMKCVEGMRCFWVKCSFMSLILFFSWVEFLSLGYDSHVMVANSLYMSYHTSAIVGRVVRFFLISFVLSSITPKHDYSWPLGTGSHKQMPHRIPQWIGALVPIQDSSMKSCSNSYSSFDITIWVSTFETFVTFTCLSSSLTNPLVSYETRSSTFLLSFIYWICFFFSSYCSNACV